MKLYTAVQMKEIDRAAIKEHGIPSTLLMERAAKAIVREVVALPAREPKGAFGYITTDGRAPTPEQVSKFWANRQRSAVVYCGPGNNGGDGIAAARFLLKEGWNVRCFLVGSRDKMTEDSREMERRLVEAGGALKELDPENWVECDGADVAIDALFGIGLNSDLREDAQEAVRQMKLANWIVSADIPSGIHADTGEVLGHAVKADVTVTFSAGKPGLFVGKGAIHAGRVVVADIGIPQEIMDAFQPTTVAMVKEYRPRLPKRKRDAHKGDFGRVFILAGSVGYTGAPVLASRAAVRSGAGLVTLAVPREIYPIVAVKCDEAMPWPLPDSYEEILQKASAADVVLIGPGLGQSDRAEELVLYLLRELKCPVVLDADGLNILSRHMYVLDERQGMTIMTPHDGEFARLAGCTLPIVDRLETARQFALQHRCILVLKGHRTVISANGICVVNTTGNPGMAQGGSGDALAGLIAGMMAQKQLRHDAVADAVWIHGHAGDLAAADKGEYGMTVGDLIGQIPYAMKECEEV